MAQGHLQKLVGKGLDIGAGNDPFHPVSGSCRVWDQKFGDGDAAILEGLAQDSVDYIYASHCLEHLAHPVDVLQRWLQVIRTGGYLYLAVPDFDLYEGGHTIRNRFHRCAFSLDRATDLAIPIYNLITLYQEHLSQTARLQYAALCDDNYNYSLPREMDQTKMAAVCHIELMLQKR